jgi:hypothetical protein
MEGLMTPLAIPFKLKAKIERLKKDYWYDQSYWQVTLNERAPGLPAYVMVPLLISPKLTRQQAIEYAGGYYAMYDVVPVFRKSPVRKPTLKQRMRDAQTIQRACI